VYTIDNEMNNEMLEIDSTLDKNDTASYDLSLT